MRNFLGFISYDIERALAILNHTIENNDLDTIYAAKFKEYENPSQLDSKELDAYHECFDQFNSIAKKYGIDFEPIEMSIENPSGEPLTQIEFSDSPLIVDISCAPRAVLCQYILSLSDEDTKNIDLLYAVPVSYPTSHGHFSDGIRAFKSYPLLTGRVRHKPSVCIVCAGLEGSRTFAAYRRIAPLKTHIMIAGHTEKLYRDAIKSNCQMLARPDVKTSRCTPYDPVTYSKELCKILNEFQIGNEAFNIYIVPMGTKLQTLAGAIIQRKLQYLHFLFPVPVKRKCGATKYSEIKQYSLDSLIQEINLCIKV